MTENIDISLDVNGKHYKGWATPSGKNNKEGLPKSFHVVLNDVMFGNVSYSNDNWVIDEQRPPELVEAVGSFLQKHL
jgi:hypothetical protein